MVRWLENQDLSAFRVLMWAALVAAVFIGLQSRIAFSPPGRIGGGTIGFAAFFHYPNKTKKAMLILGCGLLVLLPLAGETALAWWLRQKSRGIKEWSRALDLAMLPLAATPILAVAYGPKRAWWPIAAAAALVATVGVARASGCMAGWLFRRRESVWGAAILLAAIGAGILTNSWDVHRNGLDFWIGALSVLSLAGPLSLAAAKLVKTRLTGGIRVAAVALLPWALAPGMVALGAGPTGPLASALGRHPVAVLGAATLILWAGGVASLRLAAGGRRCLWARMAQVTFFLFLAGFLAIITHQRPTAWQSWVGTFDFDNVAVWTHRASQGEVPFLDFWYPYGISIFIRKWLALKLGLLAQMAAFLQLSFVTGLLAVFLITRAILVSTSAAVFATAGAFLLSRVFPFPNGTFADIRHLIAPASLTMLSVALRRGRPAAACSAGALAAFTVFYSIEQGVFALFSSLVLVAAFFHARRPKDLLLSIESFAGGFVLTGALLSGWLAYQGALGAFASSTWTLITRGTMTSGLPFPNLLAIFRHRGDSLVEMVELLLDPYMFVIYAGLLYSSALGVNGVAIVQRRASWRRLLLFAFSLCGLAQLLVALNRPDPVHIAQALNVAFLVACVGCSSVGRSIYISRGHGQPFFARAHTPRGMSAAVVVVWSIFLLQGGRLERWVTNTSGRLAAKEAKETATRDKATILSRRWGPVTPSPERAALIKRVNEYLEKHDEGGRRLFVFSGSAAYYYLFDWRNPTKVDNLYNLYTAEEIERLIADLKKDPPTFILYDTDFSTHDFVPWSYRVPQVWDHVMAHSALETRVGSVAVLRYRPSGWPAPEIEKDLSKWTEAPEEVEGKRVVRTPADGVRPGRYLLTIKGMAQSSAPLLWWRSVDGAGYDRGQRIVFKAVSKGTWQAEFFPDRIVADLAVGPIDGKPRGAVDIARVQRRHEYVFGAGAKCPPARNISGCRVEDGWMSLTSINEDPHFYLPVPEGFRLGVMELRIKASRRAVGEVLPNTRLMKESGKEWSRAHLFSLDAPGEWQTIRVDLRGDFDRSPLDALRVDPMRDRGEVAVSKIVLYEDAEGAQGAAAEGPSR